MAYFPDLTPYADVLAGEIDDLRVGWLEAGRDVARGEAPAGLVDAILRCVTRPAPLPKGFHACDLCPSGTHGDARVVSMEFDGRSLRLGNGEVRVRASDGQWYTAPTLIVHYVAAHGYLPPAPFVGAILRRAAAYYVLKGAQLARRMALPLDAQRDVCVRAISAFPTRDPDDATYEDMDELDVLSEEVQDACAETSRAFMRDEGLTVNERRSRARACLRIVLELASERGVDATEF